VFNTNDDTEIGIKSILKSKKLRLYYMWLSASIYTLGKQTNNLAKPTVWFKSFAYFGILYIYSNKVTCTRRCYSLYITRLQLFEAPMVVTSSFADIIWSSSRYLYSVTDSWNSCSSDLAVICVYGGPQFIFNKIYQCYIYYTLPQFRIRQHPAVLSF